MVKVKVDKETCIGCGACLAFDNFKLDKNGFAEAIDEEPEDISQSLDAEGACPVYAIKVDKE